MMRALAVAAALAMAGCQPGVGYLADPAVRRAEACIQAGNALGLAAARRQDGRLSDAQSQAVDELADVTEALCADQSIPATAAAIDLLVSRLSDVGAAGIE